MIEAELRELPTAAVAAYGSIAGATDALETVRPCTAATFGVEDLALTLGGPPSKNSRSALVGTFCLGTGNGNGAGTGTTYCGSGCATGA